MERQLTLGSLFDGIAGFPLAAVRQGIKPVWASEIEQDCVDITAKQFPDMQQLGDITKLKGADIIPVDTGKEGGQQMYKTVNGEWTNDDYSKSKTVRLYPETLEVIEGYRGKNFSEKLRNLVKDFARQNQENVRQNGGNERG